MHIVYETLEKLGVEDKPIITAFNKLDKLEETPILRDFKAEKTLQISAKNGDGVNELLYQGEEILRNQKIYIERVYPYDKAGKIQLIRKYGQLLSEEYTEAGIEVKAYVPVEIYEQI